MKQPTFSMKGRIFPYPNLTRYGNIPGEMSVVIPIALHFYSQIKSKSMFDVSKIDILEIGSVLPQVLPKWDSLPVPNKRFSVFPHRVVNPTVKAEGMEKLPLLDPDPYLNKKYDLILCLENIGKFIDQETEGRAPELRKQAFNILIQLYRGCLKKDGLIIIVTPSELTSMYGSRSWMDYYLDEIPDMARLNLSRDNSTTNAERKPYHPDHVWKMNRMGMGVAGNVWKEANPAIDPDIAYYKDVPSAGSVYFLFWGQLWGNWR